MHQAAYWTSRHKMTHAQFLASRFPWVSKGEQESVEGRGDVGRSPRLRDNKDTEIGRRAWVSRERDQTGGEQQSEGLRLI